MKTFLRLLASVLMAGFGMYILMRMLNRGPTVWYAWTLFTLGALILLGTFLPMWRLEDLFWDFVDWIEQHAARVWTKIRSLLGEFEGWADGHRLLFVALILGICACWKLFKAASTQDLPAAETGAVLAYLSALFVWIDQGGFSHLSDNKKAYGLGLLIGAAVHSFVFGHTAAGVVFSTVAVSILFFDDIKATIKGEHGPGWRGFAWFVIFAILAIGIGHNSRKGSQQAEIAMILWVIAGLALLLPGFKALNRHAERHAVLEARRQRRAQQ